jgi:hypothetical protein
MFMECYVKVQTSGQELVSWGICSLAEGFVGELAQWGAAYMHTVPILKVACIKMKTEVAWMYRIW